MAFQVDRSPFDPESGFEYYICFKPQTEVEGDEVESRISVEAALSRLGNGRRSRPQLHAAQDLPQ